ncbi:hypothetical protein SEPCBS119000_004470 [Sporothrix epigloea]|uniref:CCHC-type domain-containing protein n=1 Tax=Sporothrix epigloea TaxID=1892477 RepID=A0ABP0DV71_9PEZI
MSMVAAASMDAVDEQRDLKKYFPAVDRNAIFCIGCASNGHRFAACPLRNCRLCGGITVDHTLFGCPAVALDTLTQSDKRSESELKPLHGTGKDKPKNKNKAAAVSNTGTAAPGQPSQCPYCLEECIHEVVCPRLWTTFVSDPASKRSDYKIWTACYVCGLDNHFGGDCKSNTGMHLSGRQFSRDDDIWSHKYASLFSEMKKSRSCAKVEAAGNGAGSAAVAPQSRKAKRLKAGQDDKIVPTHSSQVHSASQAAKSGNTGSNESSKNEDQ